MCRGRDTPDERERVYGLVGIAPLPLEPSYHATRLQSYMIATKCIIETTNILNILAVARTVQENPRLDAGYWSTWVPDWSRLSDRQSSFSVAFFAASSTVAHAYFRGNVMSAAGVEVAKITHVLPTSLSGTLDDLAEQARREWTWCWDYSDQTASNDGLKRSFPRAMMARHGEVPPSGAEPFGSTSNSPEYWPWNHMIGGAYDIATTNFQEIVANRLDDIMASMNKITSRTTSSFISTAEGHPGWGPANMEEGDRIVVLFGCRMPLVLRPVGDAY